MLASRPVPLFVYKEHPAGGVSHLTFDTPKPFPLTAPRAIRHSCHRELHSHTTERVIPHSRLLETRWSDLK